jgi:hypothetical protein
MNEGTEERNWNWKSISGSVMFDCLSFSEIFVFLRFRRFILGWMLAWWGKGEGREGRGLGDGSEAWYISSRKPEGVRLLPWPAVHIGTPAQDTKFDKPSERERVAEGKMYCT